VLTSLCLSISQRLPRKPLSNATLALLFTLPDMPLMVHSQVIRYWKISWTYALWTMTTYWIWWSSARSQNPYVNLT
jgi:hypothetical protein